MADRLRVNSAEMYSHASEIDGEKNQLANILETLDKSMNNIFNNSEGEAIESIHERYNILYAQYERFLQMMEAYANALRAAADKINEADVNIAKQIMG